MLTTLDPTGANVQSKTTQTLDTYGNVTQTNTFGYGNLSTPARTYNNAYITDTNYTSRYLRNRLLTRTVTNGSQSVQLVSNAYDQWNLAACYAYQYIQLTDTSGIREHDSTYGTTFAYRGLVTRGTTPGRTICSSYYITGDTNFITDDSGHALANATIDSSTNYAAPTAITASGLQTTAAWTGALDLSSLTGPNSAIASMSVVGNECRAQSVSLNYVTYDVFGNLIRVNEPNPAGATHSDLPPESVHLSIRQLCSVRSQVGGRAGTSA